MNFTWIVLLVIGMLCALGLFLGYIGGMGKSFKDKTPGIDSSAVKSQQRQTIEETERKRQQYMDDMKQKISDGYRKL